MPKSSKPRPKKLAFPEDDEGSEDLGESEEDRGVNVMMRLPAKTRPLRLFSDVFVFCFLYYPFVEAVWPL